MKFLSTGSLVVISITLIACSQSEAQHIPLEANNVATVNPSALGESLDSETATFIENFTIEGDFEALLKQNVSPSAIKAARQAYAQSLFRPLWTAKAAENFQKMPTIAQQHGLKVSDVLDHEIDSLVAAKTDGLTAEARAEADINLTAAWLKLASVISGGLSDEGDAVKSTTTRPVRSSLVDAIRDAGRGMPIDSMLQFAPSAPQYPKLQHSLQRYRDLAERGGWKSIRSGDTIEPGDNDLRVPALKKRLIIEGFYTHEISFYENMLKEANEDKDADVTAYNEPLQEAVKLFQTRHGIKADGVVGPDTFKALNESVDSKIDRIESAMEEWRDYDDMGQRYIWTNIPSYTAEAWNKGEREIVMKTIVGKAATETPAFSDEVEFVVSNPKWYVPKGIMRRQKVRKLRNDPSYADRMDYTIYDRSTREIVNPASVDWTDPDVEHEYQMVQNPGSKNALGRLKIIFPNRYSVYLHGTPQKNLFDRAERAFSSGCIRLENPIKMASWIAYGDDDLQTTDIMESQEEKEREQLSLDEHLPVHVTYVTVTVDDDGKTYFLRDIYDLHPANEFAIEEYADFDHQSSETRITGARDIEKPLEE